MAVIALKCPTIKVTVVDENKDKIKAWNSNDLDKLPVFEPGLKKLISKTRNKNLFFSNKIDLFVMVDSFFLDCEIKNSSNPKIITNPKIDKE